MKLLKFLLIALSISVIAACSSDNSDLYSNLNNYIEKSATMFDDIPEKRKESLNDIAKYIQSKINSKDTVNLIFICTHNSRRSHFSQFWAQAAAYYYGIDNIFCYSGGTEATAFNTRSIKALRKAGFKIELVKESQNPVYKCMYSDNGITIKGFSKKYDNTMNPNNNFAAVMVCSHADETCPFVFGADKRFAIPYDDPKEFDGTDKETEKYDERCRQISVEMLYIFSQLKP